jgi:hypothetical protein
MGALPYTDELFAGIIVIYGTILVNIVGIIGQNEQQGGSAPRI